MTDRELLELAAKAAGIVIYWEKEYTNSGIKYLPHLEVEGTWGHGKWNPLENDGDALRLAVKLRLIVDITPWASDAYHWRGKKSEDFGIRHTEYEDPMAATRLAIVRAAAAIAQQRQP